MDTTEFDRVVAKHTATCGGTVSLIEEECASFQDVREWECSCGASVLTMHVHHTGVVHVRLSEADAA